MKICSVCKIEKSIAEFTKDSRKKDGLRIFCKTCHCALMKMYRLRKPEQYKAYRDAHKEQQRFLQRRWCKAHPDQVKAKTLRRKYGMLLQDFKALQVLQQQRCAVCGCKHPLVVDHCHKTKRVRALLCGQCNRALGLLYEDPRRVRALLRYIQKYCKPQPVQQQLPIEKASGISPGGKVPAGT